MIVAECREMESIVKLGLTDFLILESAWWLQVVDHLSCHLDQILEEMVAFTSL